MADSTADLSRGPVLLSFSLATASFALATTFVRFYVRRGLNSGFGADDYTSGAATVIALIGTIFSILEGSPSDSTRALQFNVIGQPWYLISSTLSKVSICLFFMSLLRRARQWRILLAGLIVVMGIINSAFALAVYLQCRPLDKVWNPSAAGSCSDPSIQINFGYAQGAFSVFSWVFLALFPMLILRDISRGGEPTWPFYATAALSFVCGIFVIVRTAQTSQTTGVSIYTIHFFYASLMANLEQNLSLITSNLLTLGPLFSTTTTTTTTSSSSSTTRSSSSSKSKPRRPRRDPYSSSSSTGTRRNNAKRTLTQDNNDIPSRAGSSRSITRPDSSATTATTRASSRASSYRGGGGGDGGVGVVDGGNGEIDRKRTTHLIIEGPGADRDLKGGDLGEGGDGRYYRNRGGNGYGYGYGSEEEEDEDEEEGYGYGGYGSDGGSEIDLEAWPRGIIKTVSVEVVEEVNEEYVAAKRAEAAAMRAREEAERTGILRKDSSNTGAGGVAVVGGGAVVGAAGGSKGGGRNSVVIVPAGGVGMRQPRVVGGDNSERVSGGSVVEQDWEAMLRAGPPR